MSATADYLPFTYEKYRYDLILPWVACVLILHYLQDIYALPRVIRTDIILQKVTHTVGIIPTN